MKKTAIVTGANTGLGFAAAKGLVERDYHVVLACRSREKGRAAQKELGPNALFRKLDMTSFSSIEFFLHEIKNNYEGIDLLYNNAGIMYVPFKTTEEGFESTIATNYLGTFYSTLELLELMKYREDSRIVQVSSIAMYLARDVRLEGLHEEKDYNPWAWYNYSNLYRTMFAFELDEKLKDHHTKVVVAHPGITKSRLRKRRKRTPITMGFDLISTNIKTGVAPILEASTSLEIKGKEVFGPGIIHQYGKPRIYKGNKIAYDKEERKKLWNYSVDVTGKDYR